MTFIKTNWLTLILLGLVLFILFKDGCNKPPAQQPTVTRSSDSSTTQVQQPTIVVVPSTPQVSTREVPVYIPQPYQPSNDNDKLREQYNELVKKYLAINTYKDSVQLKDTAGNRVGVFNYNDKVTGNEITQRQPSYQLSFPKTTITNTTTITLPYQPKKQLYLGGEVTGSQYSPINGVNLGIIYKDRADRIYTVKGGLINLGPKVTWQGGIGRYWKL